MFKNPLILILLFFTLKTYAQADTMHSSPVRGTVTVRDSFLQRRQPVSPAGDSVKGRDSSFTQVQGQQPEKPVIYTLSWEQDTAYRKLYRNLYPAGKGGAIFMITSI